MDSHGDGGESGINDTPLISYGGGWGFALRVVVCLGWPALVLADWTVGRGVSGGALSGLAFAAVLNLAFLSVRNMGGRLVGLAIGFVLAVGSAPAYFAELFYAIQFLPQNGSRALAAAAGLVIAGCAIAAAIKVTARDLRELHTLAPSPTVRLEALPGHEARLRLQRRWTRVALVVAVTVDAAWILFWGLRVMHWSTVSELTAVTFFVLVHAACGLSGYLKSDALRVLGLSVAFLGGLVTGAVLLGVTLWIFLQPGHAEGAVGPGLTLAGTLVVGALMAASALFRIAVELVTLIQIQMELRLIHGNHRLVAVPVAEEDLGAGTGWDHGSKG